MRKLRKFLQLNSQKRSLLVRAALLLLIAKTSLAFLPFRLVRRFLNRFVRASFHTPPADPVICSRIGWAVAAAGRRIPGGKSCLPQALTAELLLRSEGLPSRLQIGVARDEKKNFQAHAWIESQGRVVVGGPALSHYTPLAAFDGEGGSG